MKVSIAGGVVMVLHVRGLRLTYVIDAYAVYPSTGTEGIDSCGAGERSSESQKVFSTSWSLFYYLLQ